MIPQSCQRDPLEYNVNLLDEPTTGLHFEDITKLLGVLQRLTDAGNSVIVIEHNIDVIKTADWIIILGPKAGSAAAWLWPKELPRKYLWLTSLIPGNS